MISHEPREEGRSRENYADSLKVSEQSVETRHRCAWCPVRPSWDIYISSGPTGRPFDFR